MAGGATMTLTRQPPLRLLPIIMMDDKAKVLGTRHRPHAERCSTTGLALRECVVQMLSGTIVAAVEIDVPCQIPRSPTALWDIRAGSLADHDRIDFLAAANFTFDRKSSDISPTGC
jgi:hypothetical protein